MTITFTADGLGHCLYGEAIEIQALGRLSCRRASTVEFDLATQQWQVRCANTRDLLFVHPSRERCLASEQEHLEPL